MTAFRYVIAPAMGLLLAAPASAQASSVTCGSTITADTKLRADLTNCPGDGLVIGADGITLDLRGRTIDGSGSGAAIRLSGRRGVTIKGGTVREFATGLVLEQATGARVKDVAIRAVAGRAVDVTGGSGNAFEGLASTGNRTGLALTDTTRNSVRGSAFSDNAITGVLLFGATRNRVELNRFAGNVGNGVAVVEGADHNTVAANAVEGSQTGLIVDAADGNALSLNRVTGAGDGVLVAGDRNTVAGNLVDRSVGGCDGCSGWGIGVTAGTGNVVSANLVQRSSDDGIHVEAPGTWIAFNVVLRSGGQAIDAVEGVRDGGGNRGGPCSGVRCL
jgi:nitrous oxidase accessory protein NosD